MNSWPWYVSRAAGLVAWCLLTIGVVNGLLLALKRLRKPSIAWHTDLHRMFAACGVLLIGVHVGALAFDEYIEFSANELFVPGASSWEPIAVGFGIVSMYLLVAVEGTSLIRNSLPPRLWHGVHMLAVAVFVGGSVHAFMAGPDSRGVFALVTMFGAFVAVGLLVAARIGAEPKPRRALSRVTPGV